MLHVPLGFLRRLLAVGLAALFLIALLSLTPRSFTTSAQQPSDSKPSGSKHFILYQSAEGEMVCRAATREEGIQLDSVDPSRRGLRPINHLQSDRYAHRTSGAHTAALSGTNLTIILR